MRSRRASRVVNALAGREAETVAILLEGTGGNGWPWPKHVHKTVAHRLGISETDASCYLAALRRTVGLPVLPHEMDGPRLMTDAWRARAAETGDWGIFTPVMPRRR